MTSIILIITMLIMNMVRQIRMKTIQITIYIANIMCMAEVYRG